MVRFAGWFVLVLLSVGCGGSGPGAVPEGELANRKLAALERLADALAKNPAGGEAMAGLDAFRNVDFDPKSRPDDAQKILDYFDKNLKGKYQGEVARQLQIEIGMLKANMTRS